MEKLDVVLLIKEAGGDDWALLRDFMPELERLILLVEDRVREQNALTVEDMGMKGYGTLAIAAAIRNKVMI